AAEHWFIRGDYTWIGRQRRGDCQSRNLAAREATSRTDRKEDGVFGESQQCCSSRKSCSKGPGGGCNGQTYRTDVQETY
ncbi:hypothetical protein M569_00711, partial [Genlisea aurea]